MGSGPRSRLLTIDPNLAVPILVSSGHQRLGFFHRQVSGIRGEALEDEPGEKSRGGSQVEVTLQARRPDGGLAPAQLKQAAGRRGWPWACVRACVRAAVLGRVAQAVAGHSRVGVHGRTGRPQRKVDLTAGRSEVYSANPTNAKVSSLHRGHAGNWGHREGSHPKK